MKMPQKRGGAQGFYGPKRKKCNSDCGIVKKEYVTHPFIDDYAMKMVFC
ncbi:peroxiredoxin [Enterobacter bugandensis]|jgi:hypothetical protein|nr:peroxiredoxin [Enterobacter bugandensis]